MDRHRSVDSDTVMDAADTLQGFIKPKKSKKDGKEIENNVRRKQQELEEYRDLQQGFEQDFGNDMDEDYDHDWDLEM